MEKTDLGITLGVAGRKLKARNKGKAVSVFPIPREGILSGIFGSRWGRLGSRWGRRGSAEDRYPWSQCHICASCALPPGLPPLSRCPQRLGQCREISSLHFCSLRSERIANSSVLPGSHNNHLQQTKAPLSHRELGRSGEGGQARQPPPFRALLDQIPRLHSFSFHFVWINFTLPHDSHFLSRLQSP